MQRNKCLNKNKILFVLISLLMCINLNNNKFYIYLNKKFLFFVDIKNKYKNNFISEKIYNTLKGYYLGEMIIFESFICLVDIKEM